MKSAITYCLLGAVLGLSSLASAENQDEALNLSVEDLLNVEVTSAAKKAQSLNDAAAAIFVITNEDIKRSGVTNIPDALRLAPGLDIAESAPTNGLSVLAVLTVALPTSCWF